MGPSISVIIPVYNKEEYVARTLHSVLDQTPPNLEILIVDDASTDRSLERVAEFDDPRIRVLRRDTPGPGGYAARNLGIRQATGEWIAFLDADDCWRPDHLENALDMAEQNPEVPIISAARLDQFGSQQRLDPFSQHFIAHGPQRLYLADYIKQARQGRRAMQTNTLLIRRAALFSHELFPEGRTARSGDLYAWITLLARLKVMVWSPHIAATSYRDVIGVSRTSTPTIQLFQEMVEELAPHVSRDEHALVRGAANQLIKYAWIEKKKKRMALPLFGLPSAFFWKGHVRYCLKWSLISMVPITLLEAVHRRFLAK
ncbi:glycosyltransferase family A protein [Halomonas sp. CKK8]|uniref:glycosyltransferase family 2 protein n=1 Tax=Halomonas sp. CKK8 TaxID=3036127 RepID=UPI002414E18C|nr:glycosyltransferase family A protein [Halomonas sp. CKK8]WFM70015.1 glycosyltransferase family A protein [Halomonas sp. CKK8]